MARGVQDPRDGHALAMQARQGLVELPPDFRRRARSQHQGHEIPVPSSSVVGQVRSFLQYIHDLLTITILLNDSIKSIVLCRGILMNDCAGEVIVDLRKYYRKAYKRGVALKLFETKKGGAAKRAAKKADEDKKPTQIFDDRTDIPPDEKPEEEEVKEGQEVKIGTDGPPGGESVTVFIYYCFISSTQVYFVL